MTNTLTMTDVDLRPFDFTTLFAARPRALALAATIRSGDDSVETMTEARALLAECERVSDLAIDAMRSAGVRGIEPYDVVVTVLNLTCGMSELDSEVGIVDGYHAPR